MARRRFQSPKPFKEGKFWWLRIWDSNVNGSRKRERIMLAPATMPLREVQKIADDELRPVNHGLTPPLPGRVTKFGEFVTKTYKPTLLESGYFSSSTKDCYAGVIAKYLEPKFGSFSLREITRLELQRYFSGLAHNTPYPTISKIRDAMSSILRYAVEIEYISKNPMEGLRLPKDKRPRRPKPTITPDQFKNLLELLSEPYATMVFVAVWTGLRVSELLGLKWRCIHRESITVEERYCRGDWSVPKTAASAATIGVVPEVISRLQRLKTLTVELRAGIAGTREFKLVKSDDPDALVFQSVTGGPHNPLNDQNILKRHLQPAARKLGLAYVNWRCLRTSHATWLVQAGADPKSVQGQMRHSRSSTTFDIYAQIVATSQRRALEQLSTFARTKIASGPKRSNSVQ